MTTWRKIMTGMIILMLTGVGYGWYLFHKLPPDIRREPAGVTIQASDLLKAFTQNETRANQQYVDKVIIVSGKVTSIQVDAAGKATLFLDTGDPLAAVTCSFYNEEKEAVKKLSEGALVKVKGVCTGLLTDVILNKCSIAE